MAPKRRTKAGQASDSAQDGFTPQRFEKELKDLAAKAKDESWTKDAVHQASTYGSTVGLVALMGLYSTASQMALSPVYGAIPAAIWHSKLVLAACFLGWAGNVFLARVLPVKPRHLIPVVALCIPSVQFFMFGLSASLTGRWGPVVTELLTLFPLMVLSVACIASDLEYVTVSSLPKFIGDSAPGLASFALFRLVESYGGKYLMRNAGKTFFHTRMGLEMLLGASYGLLSPSKLLVFSLPAVLHTAFFNPHVPTPMALAALQGSLKADQWILLDRKESLTGYISVIESIEQGFRVLRCDHSILGGEWVKFKGAPVAEPIYGVFVMLEAVRLVEVEKSIKDSDASALVIGLGVGTTPAAFVVHGIDTTIVEIDPVVYEFASKYFQLPAKHTPVIDDAILYTWKLSNDAEGKRFDYIVHDVFTGGAEPIPLFTLEFLQVLNSLLKPDGVIAINYAGDFLLPPPKVVVQTIRQVFPSCRIFREAEGPSEAKIKEDGQDFTNMVIFCKKTTGPLTFRDAGSADHLGSLARKAFLMPAFEVADTDFRSDEDIGLLTFNQTKNLEKWHDKSALGHWDVMRLVLPAMVWEMW